MYKIFFLFCFSFALLFATSCQEYLDIENDVVSQSRTTPDPKIEMLIQQARQGKTEAYDALAVCYRDGDGVRQSLFNMMTMYSLSCKKSGKNLENVIRSLGENNPLCLLIDVLDHSHVEDIPQESVVKLREVSPADAMIYDAFYALKCKNDTVASEDLLKEAAKQGSDLACVIQLALYQHLGYNDKYEYYLHEYADRYPVVNVLLGDLYMKDISDENLQKAVMCYTAADRYGMLTAGGARRLSKAYRMLESEGKMKCNSKEMERLANLAQ